MRAHIYLRSIILAILVFTFASSNAQNNPEKIKAVWSLDKFETEKNTPQAIKATKNLEGLQITFGKAELVISKKTPTGDTVIKKGLYSISGNIIILGKDQAEILVLSEDRLNIKIKGQGIIYLTRLL
jgi:hypothetical protein